MVEVRGKFVMLAAEMMGSHEKERDKADDRLFRATGRHWGELDPEAWYDIRHANSFIRAYAEASPKGETVVVAIGEQMYPTIARTTGLPERLKTPMDYLRYETEGYLTNVRGRGVTPKRIVKMEDGHAIIEAKIRAWDCRIQEGVYLGILGLAGVSGGVVEHKKCVRRGDPVCEFHIKWQPAT